ncbi:peptidoglycan editing factor PgeF [Parvularcula maris]|uniref:Purine nucleoside phosphorylase n=1 Tax=Parvularcula maris TaxID=2965077 RepID=A0A9X2RHK0_9PROT|nr:peptidoglycan editing factor PgeF [Parvularcula maris]MCQ8185025.1 peptidoglycan editing factor PgeF [Parvularcula maris]
MTAFYDSSPHLSSPHGAFRREGGVSTGIYEGLNASYHSGDDRQAVDENRRRIREALGADHLIAAKQVHSAKVVIADALWKEEDRPEADAIVTTKPGLAVGVLTADCVPILFEAEGMVAAAHAGWRGSLLGIIGNTVDRMAKLGAERAAIRALIGAHLRGESFEVKEDLIEQVLAAYPDAERHFYAKDGKTFYDHTGFVLDRLREAGIEESRIVDLGGDTLAEPDRYFSYRASQRRGEPKTGHNMTAICLPKE